MKGAENKFAAIEDLTDEELEDLHEDCRGRAEMALKHIEKLENQRHKIANENPNPRRRNLKRRRELLHSF